MSFLFALAAVFSDATAGDWPQILGPQRDGIAEDESIVDSFQEGGPKTVWQRGVGSGFAGLAVADGMAVLFHRVGDVERVEAMHAGTGEVLWKTDFPAKFVPRFVNDNGPRCVPLIHNGRVYVYGAMGGLHALDLKTGETLWSRDTFEEYKSKRSFRGEPPEGYFGIGTSPIVLPSPPGRGAGGEGRDDGKLLVNVGGAAKGAGIVAFDLRTGKTIWKATEERTSYSSPVAATVDGTRHVIFATRFNVVSINPENGDVQFRIPFGEPGPNVTAATPVILDDHLFVSAAYGFGAVFAKIKTSDAEVLWRRDDVMSSQYTTCIEHEGNLYGVHGRQDVGRASLRCFDPNTATIHWTEPDFGYATLIKADGKLLILTTDGELVLAEPSPERYRELDRTRLFHSTTRALPALANGYLYVRDTQTLKCIELSRNR